MPPVNQVSLRLVASALAGLLAIPLVAAEKATAPAQLPAPNRIIVPKLRANLTVDGDLDEPVWAKAAVISGLQLNDGSGPEREQTTVRVWYDDTALYLGWTCKDTDIQATMTARDSRFWEEEVAEFFVTAKELTRYFELQWSPLGGVFDAIISNELDEHGVSKKMSGDWSFTAEKMRSAVKRKGTVSDSTDTDEYWQVEAVIPFADLGQPAPRPKEVWRANFYRFNRGKDQKPEGVAWSPTRLPSFHQPSRFGYLEFGP